MPRTRFFPLELLRGEGPPRDILEQEWWLASLQEPAALFTPYSSDDFPTTTLPAFDAVWAARRQGDAGGALAASVQMATDLLEARVRSSRNQQRHASRSSPLLCTMECERRNPGREGAGGPSPRLSRNDSALQQTKGNP